MKALTEKIQDVNEGVENNEEKQALALGVSTDIKEAIGMVQQARFGVIPILRKYTVDEVSSAIDIINSKKAKKKGGDGGDGNDSDTDGDGCYCISDSNKSLILRAVEDEDVGAMLSALTNVLIDKQQWIDPDNDGDDDRDEAGDTDKDGGDPDDDEGEEGEFLGIKLGKKVKDKFDIYDKMYGG